MNINTGETYERLQDALDSGVPRSDIAEINGGEVRFSSGPFKGRTYRRTTHGLVRVDRPAPSRGPVSKYDGDGELVAVKP